MISPAQLHKIALHCPDPAKIAAALNAAGAEWGIDTPLRMAHFVAQWTEETGEFTRSVENLNYSAHRLAHVWPRHFAHPRSPDDPPDAPRYPNQLAHRYARKPEQLANFVYGNRKDLGNGPPASGDGWRYRGRGLPQLTGRGNYRAAGEALVLNLEDDPDQLLDPMVGARVAGWFWSKARGKPTYGGAPLSLNELADRDDIETITRAVNGGLTNLDIRIRYLSAAKAALGI